MTIDDKFIEEKVIPFLRETDNQLSTITQAIDSMSSNINKAIYNYLFAKAPNLEICKNVLAEFYKQDLRRPVDPFLKTIHISYFKRELKIDESQLKENFDYMEKIEIIKGREDHMAGGGKSYSLGPKIGYIERQSQV